jgi:hypothetical protein
MLVLVKRSFQYRKCGDELLPVEKDKILKPAVEKVEPSITEGVKVIEDLTPVKRERSIRVKKKRDILDI